MTEADLEAMNETDVRESIVRPLIEKLGYQYGSDAYIRTEVRLSYPSIFLGRKNPKKDPPLTGRADYICGVVAAGKWVTEVKAPSEDLSEDAVQQAHTYAAHPEIAAYYFLLTNGRNFALYETSRLEEPLLEWNLNEQDSIFARLSSALSPEAIRRRSRLTLIDPGNPLGAGLASRMRVVGGTVCYDEQVGDHPLLPASAMQGLQLPVTGGKVYRDADRRLHAEISIANVAPLMKSMGTTGLSDKYDFYSSSDYLSKDRNRPTIFQNVANSHTSEGSPVSTAGFPSIMPFEMSVSALTEAVGFVEGYRFQGTMRIESDIEIGRISPTFRSILEGRFGLSQGRRRITQIGKFTIELIPGV